MIEFQCLDDYKSKRIENKSDQNFDPTNKPHMPTKNSYKWNRINEMCSNQISDTETSSMIHGQK